MNLETVYHLKGHGYEEKDCFVFDVMMHDDIGSHRYYYLDENLQIKRIKTINRMLEYFEHNGVELDELSLLAASKLVYHLSSFYLASNKKHPVVNKKDDTNEINEFIDNLADVTDFDNNILNKSIEGWKL